MTENDPAGDVIWPHSEANDGRPMSGVRVLDLSRVLAGPLCAMILADLGADVVKVESPSGDETRRWGPPFHGTDAAYYFCANRNKWDLVLDFKTPGGRSKLDRLVMAADVIVHNFPGDVSERLGLGFSRVASVNSKIVYVTISGFGPAEPERRGYDVMAQALGGLMAITGEDNQPPVRVGVAICDIAAGLYAAIGAQGGLRQRERTGKPQRIDVSLMDTSISLLANQAMSWLLCGEEPGRFGGGHPTVAPYGTFPTSDGYIVVAVGTDDQFCRFVACVGMVQLAADPRFLTNASRIRYRDELNSLLRKALVGQRTDEWEERLRQAGVPASAVRSVGQALSAPEARSIASIESNSYGEVRQILTPIMIDGRYLAPYLAPPELGEHSGKGVR